MADVRFEIRAYTRQFGICGITYGILTSKVVAKVIINPTKPYHSFGIFPSKPSRIMLRADIRLQITKSVFDLISILLMKILTKAKIANEIAKTKYSILFSISVGLAIESRSIACNSANTKEITAVAILKCFLNTFRTLRIPRMKNEAKYNEVVKESKSNPILKTEIIPTTICAIIQIEKFDRLKSKYSSCINR